MENKIQCAFKKKADFKKYMNKLLVEIIKLCEKENKDFAHNVKKADRSNHFAKKYLMNIRICKSIIKRKIIVIYFPFD